MSPGLPTGTVTFLFTDIEGSTKLVARLGDAAFGELLDQEGRVVLEATAAEGGVPFGSEGDAHFVAFASAAAAIRGAVAAQRALMTHPWPEDAPIVVRMGVHSGEVLLVEGDYRGYEVHRAARVASAANGGQVLVSGPARALAGDPGDGIALRDLGEHALKDVTNPERLYQVEAPGLRADFPPPRTAGPVTGNLPVQLTSFVGRAEVDAALELLSRTRLLTLTGPWRHRQDPAVDRARGRLRGPLPGRRVVRAAGAGHGARAGAVGHRCGTRHPRRESLPGRPHPGAPA